MPGRVTNITALHHSGNMLCIRQSRLFTATGLGTHGLIVQSQHQLAVVSCPCPAELRKAYSSREIARDKAQHEHGQEVHCWHGLCER